MESSDLHYPIVGAEIRRELYTLLALLYADETMAKLALRKPKFADLSSEVSRSVLPLKFLTVAAAVRGVLDGGDDSPRLGDGDACGRYFPNAAKKDEKPLSLRRACDSAIHADSTRFFQQESENPDLLVFGGRVILRGHHRNRRPPHPWKAEIDMEKFALASIAAINSAQD